MIMTRHKVDAGEAMDLGIVSAVVFRDEIIEKVVIKAEKIQVPLLLQYEQQREFLTVLCANTIFLKALNKTKKW